MTQLQATRPAYRAFDCTVTRVRRLSPSFLRLTLTGSDLDTFGTAGLDQRIKLVLPRPGLPLTAFPRGEDWYARWREMALRHDFRTYSVRAVRPVVRELDVDIALHPLHADSGPALRFALDARPGDELVVVGPDQLSPAAAQVGFDWRPGAVDRVLLLGDETAAPAIAAIVTQLHRQGSDLRGTALVEVPDPVDAAALSAEIPPGTAIDVRFLPRGRRVPGQLLTEAVREWAQPRTAVPHLEADEGVLWDVPDGRSDGDLYAWIAGEAGLVTSLRRWLVTEAGLDRRRCAFMGYWRRGRAEAV